MIQIGEIKKQPGGIQEKNRSTVNCIVLYCIVIKIIKYWYGRDTSTKNIFISRQ